MKTEHNEREHVDKSDPKPDKVTGNKRKATSETISFLYIYINIWYSSEIDDIDTKYQWINPI